MSASGPPTMEKQLLLLRARRPLRARSNGSGSPNIKRPTSTTYNGSRSGSRGHGFQFVNVAFALRAARARLTELSHDQLFPKSKWFGLSV